MKQLEQRRFDALLRVQAFLDTNASTVGAIATSAARKELDDAVNALTGHSTVQGSADRTMTGQKSNERAIEAAIRNEHMKPIATYARARLRGSPNIAALSRVPENAHGPRLVHAARSMATAAAPYAADFAASGLPADTVQQLAAAADELQSALTDRSSSKLSRIGATKAIEEQLINGREAISILHAIVSKQFAKDPTFLAGWNAARRVTSKLGPVRGGGGQPLTLPTPVALPPSAPVPVASASSATVA